MGAQFDRESEIELIRDIGHGRYGQVNDSDYMGSINHDKFYDRSRWNETYYAI